MSIKQPTPSVAGITKLIVEHVIQPLLNLPPIYSRANLHIAIEGNMTWVISDHIAEVFKEKLGQSRTLTFSSQTAADDTTKIGFWTSNKTKEQGVQILMTLLTGSSLFFDANFFGSKATLLEQLTWLRKVRTGCNLEKGETFCITGKTKSKTRIIRQDDQAISLLIALHAMHQIIDTVKTSIKRARH